MPVYSRWRYACGAVRDWKKPAVAVVTGGFVGHKRGRSFYYPFVTHAKEGSLKVSRQRGECSYLADTTRRKGQGQDTHQCERTSREDTPSQVG